MLFDHGVQKIMWSFESLRSIFAWVSHAAISWVQYIWYFEDVEWNYQWGDSGIISVGAILEFLPPTNSISLKYFHFFKIFLSSYDHFFRWLHMLINYSICFNIYNSMLQIVECKYIQKWTRVWPLSSFSLWSWSC